MTFRKALFWTHLTLAVPAAIFIFLMSATGVLIAYERSILGAIDASQTVSPQDGEAQLTVDELAVIAREKAPEGTNPSLRFLPKEDRTVIAQMGRQGRVILDPYTGEELPDLSAKAGEWFHKIEEFHRWLALEGDARGTGRMLTGVSNLIFIFLIVSGLYLWIPKVFKWVFFRQHLFFLKKYPTAKARDYNWHHVMGIWALIPLFLIATSATVFNYSWANNLVYKAFGEEPPQRGRRGGGPSEVPAAEPVGDLVSLQTAFETVQETDAGWTLIVVDVPAPSSQMVQMTLHNGNGYLPEQRVTLHYDRTLGEITRTEGYDEMSSARKARIWLRYIHTGEQYGIIGVTIATLASLAACFLAYTGIALAFRRLILPLFRKRKKA
ncbi:PepSY-associated TM helix domain-containing protein [Parvularcula marina]|uniref:PepSY-associated TM helix domain-containing protein n=1 Tax=Parvularcula marina TaxID=2292771 RepID=UPI0035145B36